MTKGKFRVREKAECTVCEKRMWQHPKCRICKRFLWCTDAGFKNRVHLTCVIGAIEGATNA